MPKLSSEKWSFKYDKCTRCRRTRYRHRAKGMCEKCYKTQRRLLHCYLSKFGKVRLEQLRLNPACELCGAAGKLVVHHRNQNKKDDRIENFATLCMSCHSGLHLYIRLRERFKDCNI